MKHTFTQRQGLPMMTPAALLTRVGRVDCHIHPASFFRFAGQFAEKLRPRGIMNALSETMIMRHAVDMQIFYADDSMGINDRAALLMGEVVPSERYAPCLKDLILTHI